MSVCLLAETGSKFREEYFPSLGNIAPKILLLWRGLFDELIVLSQHSLSNANLFQNIAKDVKRRQNYEMAVKS